MSSIQSQAPPEAAGPGSYDASGAVHYGASGAAQARTGRIPLRRDPPAGQDAPVNVVPQQVAYGCQRCQAIPDQVLTPLRQALGGQR